MAAAGATTYREFFGVVANDPHAAHPTAIIQAQAPGGPNAPAEIRAVVGTDPNPDPYLLVTEDGRVHVVVRIQHVPHSYGQNQSRFAGQLVGQLDDVSALGNTLVAVPDDAFHRVNNGAQMDVLTLDEMEAQIVGMGDGDLLDPPAAGAPNVEQVQARYFTFIAYRYASLIIGLGGCPALVAFQTIIGAIRADNALADQAPLVDVLRAAVTRDLDAVGDPLVAHPALDVVVPDQPLIRQRTDFLVRDLPGAYSPAARAALAQNALVPAVRALQQAVTTQGQQAAQARVKTVDEVYGAALATVRRLTGEFDTNNMPPVFQAIATAGRSQARMVLQQAITTRSTEPGAATHHEPVVTTQHKEALTSGRLHGTSRSDLSTGVTLFNTFQASDVGAADQISALSAADLAEASDAGISMTESAGLRQRTAFLPPSNVHHALERIKLLSLYLDVIKGVNHPLSVAVTFMAFV
jgi:hypothetical protein